MVLTLAGHHPPLVLRATGAVEEIGTLGTALGLFEDPYLQDTTLHLAPEDLLCVFTDGLVEARSDGEMFGTERVADLIRQHQGRPVADVATLMVEAVHSFHGPQLADDLAILLITHRQGAVPE